jgi:hypothetical protein
VPLLSIEVRTRKRSLARARRRHDGACLLELELRFWGEFGIEFAASAHCSEEGD